MKHSIEEIKKMLAEITPGEWKYVVRGHTSRYGDHVDHIQLPNNLCADVIHPPAQGKEASIANAQFIAAAPSIIRDLLAEVERLDAENLELNAGLAEFNVIHQALKDSEAQLQAAESKIKWWEEHHNSEMDKTCAELTEAENLAASRLADQEAIERHTARECAEIAEKYLKSVGKAKDMYESGAKVACATFRDAIRKRFQLEAAVEGEL